MSLPVQLELMQKPLIDELEQHAKIPVFYNIQRMPGMQSPKDHLCDFGSGAGYQGIYHQQSTGDSAN